MLCFSSCSTVLCSSLFCTEQAAALRHRKYLGSLTEKYSYCPTVSHHWGESTIAQWQNRTEGPIVRTSYCTCLTVVTQMKMIRKYKWLVYREYYPPWTTKWVQFSWSLIEASGLTSSQAHPHSPSSCDGCLGLTVCCVFCVSLFSESVPQPRREFSPVHLGAIQLRDKQFQSISVKSYNIYSKVICYVKVVMQK